MKWLNKHQQLGYIKIPDPVVVRETSTIDGHREVKNWRREEEEEEEQRSKGSARPPPEAESFNQKTWPSLHHQL